jgi:hypothetical protein
VVEPVDANLKAVLQELVDEAVFDLVPAGDEVPR